MLSCWSHWQKIRKTAVCFLSLSFCLTFAACAGKHVKSFESVPLDVPHGTLTIDSNDTGIWAHVDGQTVKFPTWYKPKSRDYAPASFRLSPGQHNIKVGFYFASKNFYGRSRTTTETSTRKPLEKVIDIQEGKETVVHLIYQRTYNSLIMSIAQPTTGVTTPLKK